MHELDELFLLPENQEISTEITKHHIKRWGAWCFGYARQAHRTTPDNLVSDVWENMQLVTLCRHCSNARRAEHGREPLPPHDPREFILYDYIRKHGNRRCPGNGTTTDQHKLNPEHPAQELTALTAEEARSLKLPNQVLCKQCLHAAKLHRYQ